MARLRKRQRVVLETLLPSDAHPTLTRGIGDTGLDDFYRDFKANGNIKLRVTFSVAMFAALWIAPLLARKLPPLSRLDREAREEALDRLYSSRIYLLRQLFFFLKLIASLCYGADDEVRKVVGFWQPGMSLFEKSGS
jgi:hypothetical protein